MKNKTIKITLAAVGANFQITKLENVIKLEMPRDGRKVGKGETLTEAEAEWLNSLKCYQVTVV